MNKQAHITYIFCDLLGLCVLWIGYSEFQLLQSEISNQMDVIRFGNRMGFSIVGVGILLIHPIVLLGNFWPGISNKIISIVNAGIIVLIAVLIIAGFVCSSWLESQVENAGYVWCSKVSYGGVVSKTLVYTKDMEICEELIEEDRRKNRRVPKQRVYYPNKLQ